MRDLPSPIPLPRTVERAILHTVAYADVFDYPLTAAQIHRYLVGVSAPLTTVDATLRDGAFARRDNYFTLPGREEIVETRRHRAAVSAGMWPSALRHGRAIAQIPFVRMVAITGALTMDNAEPETDVDYLIVTEPDRLWLCRAMIIALVVKPAARDDVEVCPNYLLSERALAITEQNLFTAHEMTQMIPIAGFSVYHHMRQVNDWTTHFLPNAGLHAPARHIDLVPGSRRPARALAEIALRTPPGAWLERWEMKRKVWKLSEQTTDWAEVAFCPDWCKGHFDSHGHLILEAFSQRVKAFERE